MSGIESDELFGWDLTGSVESGPSLNRFPGISDAIEKKVSELVLSDSNPESANQKFISELEKRIHSKPKLSKEVDFLALRKALSAHPELLEKMKILDEKGHKLNLLYQTDSYFVFVSSWEDVQKVAKDHRFLAYDKRGYLNAVLRAGTICKGSVETILEDLDVKQANVEDHNILRSIIQINGRSWLETDENLLEDNLALMGRNDGVISVSTDCCLDFASFRAKIEVPRGVGF